jgi:hypothetical protein
MKFLTRKNDKRVFPVKGKRYDNPCEPEVVGTKTSMRPEADFDRDGVKNKDDCAPLDSKRQDFLGDIRDKISKAREEHLEKTTKREEAKLEELNKKLSKRVDIEERKARQLRDIEEKRLRLEKIKEEERKAKATLERFTVAGKLKRAGKFVGTRAAIGAGKFIEEARRKQKKAKKGKKLTVAERLIGEEPKQRKGKRKAKKLETFADYL